MTQLPGHEQVRDDVESIANKGADVRPDTRTVKKNGSERIGELDIDWAELVDHALEQL